MAVRERGERKEREREGGRGREERGESEGREGGREGGSSSIQLLLLTQNNTCII